MAHSPCIDLSNQERQQLLALAHLAIEHGLEHGEALPLNPDSFQGPLARPYGSFVTLMLNGSLRGCMGEIEARQPLALSVASSAYNAAFRDPRFIPVTADEIGKLQTEVSVLSTPEAITAGSEAELLAQLLPGVDGLILEDKAHRSTFLPKVWEKLPDPQQFLKQLKSKARLPEDYWSDSIRFYRYHAENFADSAADPFIKL